ncbi:uncharacterized protein L3040_002238 [Drepanopeziza brunnea f. sp. 'multigermtubi']|uniref:Uncharacterized protein n=1 Tax=Marssonina brunnea f. sp. multigermtubi (strain MB_m1) TaxID=1072389 RepID=K1X4S3_MARBU|nr:uncharacterized protein MBM_02039 [Drepanopeziza brunnea f. sp. 'multigermtubi' MB_m1]EKD20087.1 hypothetical protein MBM_02039 [Drepanopeziza brunnea f. sp. 'multigermtubi' MB_m1]KAJ5050355.1 hypothetical protein L3040_002238 [Drepanopeziza brunnea f. sp. 'multigermtubi']
MSRSVRSRYNKTADVSERSAASHCSADSQDSQSTASTPTSLHTSPSIRKAADIYAEQQFDISPCTTFCARSSTETYASTVESLEEFYGEAETHDPDYDILENRSPVSSYNKLRPSNPSDFADYFPSHHRLSIRHDDTTHDGNMNLRVDMERKRGTIQLFHLKMNDLKKRKFSLRRYERASGREVCHSARKFTTPATERRPALSRSVSHAFASIVKPDFKRANSHMAAPSSKSKKSMWRQDSGYGSEGEDDYFADHTRDSAPVQIPTNTIKLDFSNYAQVEVKRRGAKSSKRYDFEYWGSQYAWKRESRKDGEGRISYYLYKADVGPAVAHIVPELRSPAQVREEERNGGWVPPCSMWISDPSIRDALTDVADVIVATGLIALVDDCITRHFQSKPGKAPRYPLSLPLTPLKYDMEFVGPRALVEHMFKRRNSGGSNKEKEQQRGSPLRFANPATTC